MTNVDPNLGKREKTQNEIPPIGEGILPPLDNPQQDINETIRNISQNRLPFYQSYTEGNFGIEIGNKTCFDHTRNMVVLNQETVCDRERRNVDALDFNVLHELGHLIQLYTDPDEYKKTLDICKEKPNGKEKRKLYNALLDVTVNSLISCRYPRFAGNNGDIFSEEIKSEYRKKLFKERDLSKDAYQDQFAYYLLNAAMGVGDDLTVSEPVRNALDEKISVLGESYLPVDIVKKFLMTSVDKYGKITNLNIAQTRRIIDHTLMPIFERLIQEEQQRPEEEKNQGGDGNQGKQDGDFEDISKSIADNIDKIVKDIKEKITKKNETPQDRKKSLAEKYLEKLFPNPDDTDLRNDIISVQPLIEDLKKELNRIRSETILYETQECFRPSGDDLSVESVIDYFSDVQRGTPNLPIFSANETTEKKQIQPKVLRIGIMVDLSGSMENDILELRKNLLALAGAVFSANLEAKMNDGKDAIQYQFGIYGYSDDYIELLPFKVITSWNDVKDSYSNCIVRGGTASHEALSVLRDVYAKKSSKESQNNQQEIIDILFEFTDGDTENPSLSKRLLDEIRKAGVFVEGIKLTNSLGEKNEMFDDLHPNGKRITEVKELLGVIKNFVEKILERIKQ